MSTKTASKTPLGKQNRRNDRKKKIKIMQSAQRSKVQYMSVGQYQM